MPKKTSPKSAPSTAPWHSKLNPHTREIAAWRRGPIPKSYREIAALLREKYGLKVHHATLNAFVLVRARAKPRSTIHKSFLDAGAAKPSTPPPKAPEQPIARPTTAPAASPQPTTPSAFNDGSFNPKGL